MEYKYINFHIAKNYIQEGDILLFRGTGCIARWIKKAGKGIYSHVGLASWRDDAKKSFIECVEFREWKGGRTVSLLGQVRLFPGQIDVYRVCPEHIKFSTTINDTQIAISQHKIAYDGLKATDYMRELTGLPYGWSRIINILKYHAPLTRWIFNVDINDEKDNIYPICSTAVVEAIRKHYIDLVPFKSDNTTEPSDIARSSCINYLFTLTV